jgi:hypothetical protein
MKYLCIICAEKVMEHMPEADAARHFEEYVEFADSIRKSGHFLGCNRLLPPETARTVRVRNSKVTTMDGPFAETKELFGGYFLIEAANLDEAVKVASRIPGAARGCVEVRQVAEDERTLRILGIAAGSPA